MSSIKDRQRAAARARLEKEMAERTAAARKRRQRQAIIGSALAVVVIAGAIVWIVSATGGDDSGDGNTAAAVPAGQVACQWTPAQEGGGKVKDVGGLPPASVPNTGTATLTIDTNLGALKATMDRAKVPCTAASFDFLASKGFWDNSKCHRLVNQDKFRVLQCGDPFASGKGWRETDGTGGPAYTMAEENLPTDPEKPYPAGSIAMANTGQPNSSGSQFFIVSEDTTLPPSYTLLGTMDAASLKIVQDVVKAGDDGAFAQQAGGGHPKKEVLIKKMTVAAA